MPSLGEKRELMFVRKQRSRGRCWRGCLEPSPGPLTGKGTVTAGAGGDPEEEGVEFCLYLSPKSTL